ncbi:dihydrolipoyl dehydrogenase [uncultured Desulfuromonas sp.]|uniref:dihydrolipoyl dehydrogenase family protein n=1 Tax=uncultured Desulfuromonas sp. TaxID=181013 RepID=UPI002AABD2FB|nr:dihydrolipoyl dehydrogenase [uncultured Desulfuromonas sp.]
MEQFDVIVIGSGGGTKIALPAAKRGLKTALIERDAFGGTCLNRGCIPSKMLIYPADMIYAIRKARRVNVRADQQIDGNFSALVQRVTETVSRMSEHFAQGVRQLDHLDYITGSARFVADKVVEVNGRQLTAPAIFIATGARPSIPEIPGLADTPYMTSTEALRCDSLPKRMIIIGASYIACELGHVYEAFGTETHFLVRSALLRQEDDDIRTEFSEDFRQRHTLHMGFEPVAVHWEDELFCVRVRHNESGIEKELYAEALLVSTGVDPVTDDLGLEHTAISCNDKGFIEVDDHLRTAVPGVYALGDCVGNYLFRHSVNFEGEYLMRTLFEAPSNEPIAYGAVPRAVFTVPEMAAVGAGEKDLQQQGIDYVVGRADYADSNMGMARMVENGFAKLLFDRSSHRLLGAHIIGEEASDLIHMLILGMQQQVTVEDLLQMIYIHPALPELIRDAVRDARDQLS